MEMQQLIAVLKNQVTPALGCTEPGAVALAVARAKELLGEPVRRLEVSVDKNILKNGMDVGIPGTSERGIVFAAALALVVGRSEYSLEVLRDVTAADIPKALELVAQKIITLQLDEQADGLTIRVRAFGDSTNSHVLIRNAHTNIVFEARGEEVLIDEVPPTTPTDKPAPKPEIKNAIKDYTIDQLIDFCDSVPLAQIAFIQDGVDMNRKIGNIGISEALGIGMGRFLCTQASRP
ncbi:MAG: serine dehydratase subunit alpha family protein, partial [Oscillospiraceae bacterium]